MHHKNKTEADDERKRYFHMQRPAPNLMLLTLPTVAPHHHVSEYQVQCHGLFESQQRTKHHACSIPSVASRSPPSPLQALLLCACDSLWQPAGRFTKGFSGSRPRHAPIHAAQAQTRPLKTGKRAHANRCFLQRVGSTAVAQPNLTELPRKG